MSNRKPLIAGNWKMHKTVHESVELAHDIAENLPVPGVEVMIAPVYTALGAVIEAIKGSPLKIGAQNMHPAEQGAYTGEISGPMIKDLGCDYIILGHSERREIFKETDEFINQKVLAAARVGLIPILCVGETLEHRETDHTEAVIKSQLELGLADFNPASADELVIAYEPVWAIGTGKTATPEMAQQVHGFIRNWLAQRFDSTLAMGVRILYGGSVKPGNAAALMAEKDIDGGLIGGAALTAESFLGIANYGR